MEKRLLWLAAVLLGIALSAGCSKVDNAGNDNSEGDGGSASGDGDGDGDSGDGDGDGDSSSSNGDGDGDGDASSSNGDGDGDGDASGGSTYDAGMYANVDGGIPCGSTFCAPNACCAEQFESICGAPLGDKACILPPPEDASADPRCPSLNIRNLFTLPSCCTDEGDCGIDATMFGTGCVENAEFAMAAAEMGGGNVPLDIFPGPQRCDQ